MLGLVITLATDQATRDAFTSYLSRRENVALIVVMVLLGVLVYSLSKAYHKESKYTPSTKREINLCQDIVKGLIFVLMIVFVTQFVRENNQDVAIVVAYWVYILAMVLFKVLHVLKWYYYLWGRGKDDLRPWGGGEDFLS